MPDALDNLAKLPPRCAAVMDGQAVIIKRGAREPARGLIHTEAVDQWNRRESVTPAQVQAMLVGVTLGWDSEGANPDLHVPTFDPDEMIGPFSYEFIATVSVPIKVTAPTLASAHKLALDRLNDLPLPVGLEVEVPLDLLETNDPR